MMIYKIFAYGLVLLHFFWIVFLFIGGIWGVKNKTIKIFHLSGLAFALVIQIFNWSCPLTYLEVWLRSKHDPTLAYTGSFILYYVEKIVYLEISHFVIILFTIFLCGFNLWLYLRKEK